MHGTAETQRHSFLTMMRDAKAARDEDGVTDHEADARLARAEAGDFSGLVDRESSASAGRPTTGVKEKGTASVQTTYTYAPTPPTDGNSSNRPAAPATEKQMSYIRVLLDQVPVEVRDVASPWVTEKIRTDSFTMDAASKTITALKNHVRPGNHTPDVPQPVTPRSPDVVRPSAWGEWRKLASELAGHRYATTGDDGTTDFWWITEYEGDRGTRYYLRQVIGGQGAVRVRMTPEAMVTIARKIVQAGPKESMIRFGREIGACGHCGRTLTNEESRAAGIGPVCAGKMGW